ncbi:MAG: hypothetical protein ACRD21_08825 [Vicinamibacteria bacterium]
MARVKVYAVSFRMLPSDRLAGFLVEPDDLLSDPRVLHLWDEEKVVGRWYEENVTELGEPEESRVEWDAYFLYGPETTWGDAPPEHVSWGRTIVDSRDRLLRDFSALLRDSEPEGKR